MFDEKALDFAESLRVKLDKNLVNYLNLKDIDLNLVSDSEMDGVFKFFPTRDFTQQVSKKIIMAEDEESGLNSSNQIRGSLFFKDNNDFKKT